MAAIVNYFFGIQSSYVESKITVPRFQNSGKLKKNLSLFQANIINKTWQIDKLTKVDYSESFFEIKSDIISNESINFRYSLSSCSFVVILTIFL